MVGKTQYETGSNLLGEFFSGDFSSTLQIPHYQRGYSWKHQQVIDFMDDLLEQSTFSDQYFFGIITTIDKGISNGVQNFELIDGQQRTTTAIILLVCIRDIFYELNSTLRDEVEKEIFNMDINQTQDEHYKLILDDDDDMFFRDEILNKVSKSKIDDLKKAKTKLDTHVNLRDAYLKIRLALDDELKNKITAQEKTNFLNLIRTTIRKKFIISNLDVADASKAYVLFNRMNDRGLALAPADLAKDLILSSIYEEADKQTGVITLDDGIKKWRELEIKTSKKKGKINNFIHHYLVTFHSQNTAKKFVFHSNSKTFDDLEDIINEKIMSGGALLNDLSTKFINYEALKNADITHPKISAGCEDIIKWINNMNILIVYPVLMAGIEKYSKDDFTKLCDVTLKWFFRVKTVANKNASALEEELAKIANEILYGNMPISEVKNRLSKSTYNISDNGFESNLKEISLGNKVARYILEKIVEKQQGKKITDVVPSKSISLEHIMPQDGIDRKVSIPKLKTDGTVEIDSSGNEVKENFVWMDYIIKTNKFTDKRDAISFHQNYKNRLGNLTLVDKKKNSVLGVNPFERKCDAGKDKNGVEKGCFKNSLIFLTKEIVKWNEWTKDNIEKRQRELAKAAKDIWQI